MAKPTEICTVVVNGGRYDLWESVEVSHAYDPPIDHAMLTVSEPSSGASTLAALKMKPGDPAQVYLAGVLVLNGTVYLRQAAYDKQQHAVQIGIVAAGQNIIPATVQNNPGQYKNQTLQQILTQAFGKVGVALSIRGNPDGCNIPFPRVSEYVGETLFDFANRLCMQRNMYMIDDGQGGIAAFRGPQGGGLVLKEGGNILHARLMLRNDDQVANVEGVAQDHNNDIAALNQNVSATATVPNATVTRTLKFSAEDPHNAQTLQHRVNREVAYVLYKNTDGDVTVQGWLCPDNSLWMAHVGELVTLNSPMLIPPDSDNQFMIKGVTHRQSNGEGTTTTVYLCDKNGMGSGTTAPLQTLSRQAQSNIDSGAAGL
jgi:prophage tail gpP-like protein